MDNIFPNPSEPIQDIFRICGACSRCNSNASSMIDTFKRTFEHTKLSITRRDRLYSDEYILICSSEKVPPKYTDHDGVQREGFHLDLNTPTHYISNYGRYFSLRASDVHERRREGVVRGVVLPTNYGKEVILSPLTQQFINYYNSVNFMALRENEQGQIVDVRRPVGVSSHNMILEYQKNSAQLNISYKIEQDKKRLQEIMKELQEKETDIVKQNQQIKDIKNDLLMKDKLLKEQNLELENRIGQHKKKSLKLLERENKVSVKESIETMQTELLNVSISISQLLDVVNEPILEGRIQQIINKLNEIKNTSGENLEQPVIVATEVVPQASAPEVCHAFQRGECSRGADCRFAHEEVLPSGYYASLTSLFGK
jgi:hypothetical protein